MSAAVQGIVGQGKVGKLNQFHLDTFRRKGLNGGPSINRQERAGYANGYRFSQGKHRGQKHSQGRKLQASTFFIIMFLLFEVRPV